MKEYSLLDVLINSLKVFYYEFKYLILAININIIIFFLFYYNIFSQKLDFSTLKIDNFMTNFILSFSLLLIPISFLVQTYITIIVKHHVLKINSSLLDKVKSSFNNFFNFIKATMLLIFCILIIISFIFFCLFLPFLSKFIVLLGCISIIIFLGYFRFLPYNAVLIHKTSLPLTFKYMTGHLLGSIFILICLGVVNEYFIILSYESVVAYISLRNVSSFIIMIVYFILFQLITLFITIADILYITFGYIKKRPD